MGWGSHFNEFIVDSYKIQRFNPKKHRLYRGVVPRWVNNETNDHSCDSCGEQDGETASELVNKQDGETASELVNKQDGEPNGNNRNICSKLASELESKRPTKPVRKIVLTKKTNDKPSDKLNNKTSDNSAV